MKDEPLVNPAELTAWTKVPVSEVHETIWETENPFLCNNPTGEVLPPVYRSSLATLTKRDAFLWYLNHIQGSAKLSELKPELEELIEKKILTTDEETMCEKLFLEIATAHRRWRKKWSRTVIKNQESKNSTKGVNIGQIVIRNTVTYSRNFKYDGCTVLSSVVHPDSESLL